MEFKLNDTEGNVFKDTYCKDVSIRSSKQERGDYNSSKLDRAKPSAKNLRNTPPRNDPRISRPSSETNPAETKLFLTSKYNLRAKNPTKSTVKDKESVTQKSTFLRQILMKIITGCMERGQDINPFVDFIKNELSETSTPRLGGVEKSSEGSDTMYRRGYSAATWDEIQTLDSNHKESMLSVIKPTGETSLPKQKVDMVDVLLRGDNVVLPSCESPGCDYSEETTEEVTQPISDSKAKTKRHSRPQRPSVELQSDNSLGDRTISCEEKSRFKDKQRSCEENSRVQDKRSCEEEKPRAKDNTRNCQEKSREPDSTNKYETISCEEKSRVNDMRSCEEKSRVKDKTRSSEEKPRVKDKRSCEEKSTVKYNKRSCEEKPRVKDKSSCEEEKLRVKGKSNCEEEKPRVKDRTTSCQEKSRGPDSTDKYETICCEEKSRVKDMRSCEEKSRVKDVRSCDEKSRVKDKRSCGERSRFKDKRSCEENSRVNDNRSCEEKSRFKYNRSCEEKSRFKDMISCEEKSREPPSTDECLRFKVFNSKWDKAYAQRCKVEVKFLRCI